MAEKVEFFNHGELGIIVMQSAKDLGEKINTNVSLLREEKGKNYIIPITETRFQNGEGKVRIDSTVRGKDIFIISDVGNYSCTYDIYGYTNHIGPDEHFQNIKRVLSAIGGKANRITVIMPLLYSSRQHKRRGRESLDCAMALRELEALGVSTASGSIVFVATVVRTLALVTSVVVVLGTAASAPQETATIQTNERIIRKIRNFFITTSKTIYYL